MLCRRLFVLSLFCVLLNVVGAQKLTEVAKGWSNNSVNAVIFRQNSLVTVADTQFVAFYTPDGYLAIGKRYFKDSSFKIEKSKYKGNVNDAHNCISIMVDGEGYVHVSWDHHGNPLRYAKSVAPFSLQLGEKEKMTGVNETNVTYPQFFKMPGGDLVFMFRDGQSGKGNLVVNKYDVKKKEWSQLQHNLIDGEGQRNAYWQSCVDSKGVIHVSWVWRETWDVSTNHDMCYARSLDGGKTWENSKGEKYALPINATTAEYICKIPQKSELINQTSMTTDTKGQPVIASYWREEGSYIPQFHIISLQDGKWQVSNLGFREMPFSLSGGGTKRIPISRPKIVAENKGSKSIFYLIFRDEERGSKVSVATNKKSGKGKWKITDLTDFSVGSWEPSFDTELWKDKGVLNIFVQNVVQVDGEGKADVEPQTVYVLEKEK